MLLRYYEPEISLPPCDPGSQKVNVIATLSDDISPVFPYLNAIFKNCIYNHEAQIITIREKGRMITMRPREIAVSGLDSTDEVVETLERWKESINRVWEEREKIEPSYERRKRLTALAVYKLLPGTNCKACGEPTCFIFATKLAAGQVDIAKCPPLFDEEHREKREALLRMLEEAPLGV